MTWGQAMKTFWRSSTIDDNLLAIFQNRINYSESWKIMELHAFAIILDSEYFIKTLNFFVTSVMLRKFANFRTLHKIPLHFTSLQFKIY
jgi:hypothetical protein